LTISEPEDTGKGARSEPPPPGQPETQPGPESSNELPSAVPPSPTQRRGQGPARIVPPPTSGVGTPEANQPSTTHDLSTSSAARPTSQRQPEAHDAPLTDLQIPASTPGQVMPHWSAPPETREMPLPSAGRAAAEWQPDPAEPSVGIVHASPGLSDSGRAAAQLANTDPREIVFVPMAVNIGDGFKFGCGFFLALVLAMLVGFVLLAALFALTSLFGLNLPITR